MRNGGLHPRDSSKMAATIGTEKPADEIRRLFVELQQAYSRAAEAIPSNGFADDAAAGFLKEANNASEIIRRIRKVENLANNSDRDNEKS